jgi:predicted Ser/Thr protein kinase/pimeloyl-ACP methyl ester carboxylesterase
MWNLIPTDQEFQPMRCPRCGAENPDTSTFCGSCSARLRGSTDTPFDPRPHHLDTDRVIGGKYEVAEEIGRGGMGVVYKAWDNQLKRWVALKFLPSSVADSEELRERFLLEAQAAAALSHPNICVIHEVGEDEGQSFIAMEYVEGETLRQKTKRAALDSDEATALIAQIAAGLEEAHQKGIVHRDIKSGNIMVTEKGQAKIMDFGLAKLRGGPDLTKTDTTLGTVGYMSPEQASAEDTDHRTDLWSAGVVLYELLTGELPFRGTHEVAVIHAILHEEPRSIEGREPPVPAGLKRIIDRALQKNLADRYGSASEILLDVAQFEEGVRAEAAGVLNIRSLVQKLHRPRVAIPTAVGVVGVATLAFWYTQRQSEIRWAREEALPEIARLIEANDVWRNLVPPYRLAVQAEEILGVDVPELAELFHETSREINILTEPDGANVYFKEYEHPEAEWEFLGTTPLEGVRVPIGIFRWKLEMEGYETVFAAESSWNVGGEQDMIAGYDLIRTMDPEGSVPTGMVRVAGMETPVGPIDDFLIGRYEVTNSEYKEFVDAGGYGNRTYWKHPMIVEGQEITWEEAQGLFVDESGRPGPQTWVGGDFPQGEDNYPVSGVSWYEAAAYAEYRGMSLPTALHWNVARGAFTPMIQWPQLGGFGLFAPFTNFGGQRPVPVGSLPGVTAFGAYDMAGNVREWCWNQTTQGKIVRGGSWEDNTYEFEFVRQAPPIDRSPRNGIRLAHYPDFEDLPEAALGFQEPGLSLDVHSAEIVTEEVFQVYREQFSYDPADLNAEIEFSMESPGGWTHELVSFDAAYGGERVLGHLFLPPNAAPPYQTVVYFPGSASSWMPSSEGIEDYYEFTMFLSYLVRNGRAVFYPVYKGTFERGGPEYMALGQTIELWNTYGYTEWVIQFVKDLRRSLDYLETRPDIDADRMAYYGMSWGGNMGAIIPAVEDRFQASVLVAAGLIGRGRPESLDLNYVTRVTTPTLILNGGYDVIFTPEGSARPMLELLGTPEEDKQILFYETDHIPPRADYVRESLAWLDKYLGPVNR